MHVLMVLLIGFLPMVKRDYVRLNFRMVGKWFKDIELLFYIIFVYMTEYLCIYFGRIRWHIWFD